MAALLLRKGVLFFSACVVLLALGHRVGASIVSYTDRTAFLAQVGGVTNIDFEGIAPPNSFTFYNNAAGVTLSGVNFIGIGDNNISYRLAIIDSGYGLLDPGYQGPTGDILSGPGPLAAFPGLIVVTLPAGVKAVGADMFPYGGYDVTLTAKLSTGEEIDIPNGNDSASDPHNVHFAGFVGDGADITSISFRVPATTISPTPDTLINIDNFVFATELPEPASATMLLGMAGAILAAAPALMPSA